MKLKIQLKQQFLTFKATTSNYLPFSFINESSNICISSINPVFFMINQFTNHVSAVRFEAIHVKQHIHSNTPL